MDRYNPKEIEPKWQNKWAADKIYKAIDFDTKPKFVMLTEFPYPSGEGLHLGHVREYTYGDIIARHKRMNGHNVLYPMGYDAFGLPTENYAIKTHITPQEATKTNIATFQEQFNSLGYSIDWDREITTTDPSYYRWTQWLFLQFFKAGLAYQDESAINWCPKCKTGLSNEEVVNGRHERCDTIVEKKILKQWLLKITDYAERLIDGLKDVDFPPRIADQQINWIGKSEGALVKFKIDGSDKEIEVFTTAHDTIYGVTFMVLAPELDLVKEIITDEHKANVNGYIKMAEAKTEIERLEEKEDKTGVFTGAYAINPVNQTKVPIWVADYVLASYGSGAIMAVPGEDARDHDFAKKYNLPIIYTTDKNEFVNYQTEIKSHRDKYKLANSEEFNGLTFSEGRPKILKKLEDLGVGKAQVQYKLRDWIFSRQRYWGEPIPIIHCPKCGPVAVPDKDLPVLLPEVKDYEPSDDGKSPLASNEDWVNVPCPKCNEPAKRETDTMPNWAGSSWYYLRYYDPKNDQAFAAKDKLDYWGEVDLYLGGMEHTTLHLLYSRFWHQFFYDQKLVPTKEPYHARRGQGIILAADGSKMSKSKGNVVNPTDVISSGYGADSLRLNIAFLAPYDQTTPWSPEGVAGTFRFLQRLWTLTHECLEKPHDAPESEDLKRLMARTINKVGSDIDKLSFNTAISSLMECVNEMYKIKAEDNFAASNWTDSLTSLVQLLSPFAPHISEELWQKLGREYSVSTAPWPSFDKNDLVSQQIEVVVQVNGKLRATLNLKADIPKDEAVQAALENESVKKHIGESEIKKTIYVDKKLVNFVV
ncbi:MAG TPA: leucine--tRNA ligase [Candidatus Sulfotelmatobacter sp.]|nr:leucine--tRNA ligase [Candidatus Sulfotelmatobacter sp.]